MITALWAVALAVAVLWPARLAGPLDGAPLDTAAEAIAIGLALSWLVTSSPHILRDRAFRAIVIALLLWKAATTAALSQDGWCLRFTSPVPLSPGVGPVPHAWDVRADWRTPVPRCSAIMTRGYDRFERFPLWFYNLPPAEEGEAARDTDRPPLVTLRLDLHGFLHAPAAGTFTIAAGADMTARVRVDGILVDPMAAPIAAGLHEVAVEADLIGDRWALQPAWNGRDLWSGSIATLSPPSAIDRWIRPMGQYVPLVAIAALIALAGAGVVRRAGSGVALYLSSAMAAIVAAAALSGQAPIIRAVPLLLFLPAALSLPRRVGNLFGVRLLIGLPFLALFAAIGVSQAGRFTLYSSGDDWWEFQRFAYRIFMQGYWLEGGQPTFWNQPLYRWIAGSLHMVFGDSSVGELFWDAACALAGAYFAFHVTRVVAGFRWAVAAAATTLAVFTLGPAWYLFGRGLSEITSMGFIYAAAIFAMRGRHGSVHTVLAGGLATLSFFTRMNNLPMVLALAAFAWPLRQPAADLFSPRVLFTAAARSTLVGVLWGIAIGLWLFTARTYYYTGVPSMLHGTQAGALSVWQPAGDGSSPLGNALGSVLIVLTMNDPPRLDVRALPVMAGVVAALLAVVRVRPFDRLPLAPVALCLAGLSGALVARGSAYPGRFSVHMVPVTVTLAVSAAALLFNRDRRPRSRRPAPPPPGTT